MKSKFFGFFLLAVCVCADAGEHTDIDKVAEKLLSLKSIQLPLSSSANNMVLNRLLKSPNFKQKSEIKQIVLQGKEHEYLVYQQKNHEWLTCLKHMCTFSTRGVKGSGQNQFEEHIKKFHKTAELPSRLQDIKKDKLQLCTKIPASVMFNVSLDEFVMYSGYDPSQKKYKHFTFCSICSAVLETEYKRTSRWALCSHLAN